jgi:hypothetical protein
MRILFVCHVQCGILIHRTPCCYRIPHEVPLLLLFLHLRSELAIVVDFLTFDRILPMRLYLCFNLFCYATLETLLIPLKVL